MTTVRMEKALIYHGNMLGEKYANLRVPITVDKTENGSDPINLNILKNTRISGLGYG